MIKGGNHAQEMFDGMPHDQFFHFLAAASRDATTTTTSSLSFSLHHHHHGVGVGVGGGSFPPFPTPIPTPVTPPVPQPTPSFDASTTTPPFPLSPPPHLLQQHQHHQQVLQFPTFDHQKHHKEDPRLQTQDLDWSNDEVLALLRIRSSVDNNWFPDFIWDNVSRKLGELGFKRSAEKCKLKFEEETRSFNNSIIINNNNTNTITNNKHNIIANNYRLFGELEDLYQSNSDNPHHDDDHQDPPPPPSYPDHDQDHDDRKGSESPENEQEEDKERKEELVSRNDKEKANEQSYSVNDSQETEENTNRVMRKRKRQKKFEMLKGFCEGIVNKMMAQQEELHSKILQDMVRRDEEKIAKEEAWKKQESERLRKEMEIRANELVLAGDRQAKLIYVLNKFTSCNSLDDVHSFGEALEDFVKVPYSINSLVLTHPSSSCEAYNQNPSLLVSPNCNRDIPTSLLDENLAPQNTSKVGHLNLDLPMSSSSIDHNSRNPNSNSLTTTIDHTSTNTTDHNTELRFPSDYRTNVKHNGDQSKVKDETGRRWPRDEVLALINIRCNLLNINHGESQHDKEGSNKGPLWERISQKMMEVGYKRSAKRCKEKWENINKYFRKTKDTNKRRSIDSRTCPYFHQLSHLYSQGTLVGTTDRSTNQAPSPEHVSPGGQGGSSASNDANATMHVSQGNQGLVQAPAFDFEF